MRAPAPPRRRCRRRNAAPCRASKQSHGRAAEPAAGARCAAAARRARGSRARAAPPPRRSRSAVPAASASDRCSASEQIRRLRAQAAAQVLVHRPLAERMRDVRHVEDAALVLGDEAVVRDHVGEQVAGVAHRDRALLVAAAGGEPPQRLPLVRAAGTRRGRACGRRARGRAGRRRRGRGAAGAAPRRGSADRQTAPPRAATARGTHGSAAPTPHASGAKSAAARRNKSASPHGAHVSPLR